MNEPIREFDMLPDSPPRSTRKHANTSESIFSDLAWLRAAACANLSVDDFFVPPGSNIEPAILKTCRNCPVRVACLRHVYNNDIDSGYFAGLSPSQRSLYTLDEALILIDDGEL